MSFINRHRPVPKTPPIDPFTFKPAGQKVPEMVSESEARAVAAGHEGLGRKRTPAPLAVGFTPSTFGGTEHSQRFRDAQAKDGK